MSQVGDELIGCAWSSGRELPVRTWSRLQRRRRAGGNFSSVKRVAVRFFRQLLIIAGYYFP